MMINTNIENSKAAITDKTVLAKIEQIESICGRDIGNGIEPLVEAAKGGLLGAACSIAEHPSPHIAIMTGFFVPHGTPPSAETDGPVGCVHLAAGLNHVGIPVRLVTDPLCLNALKVAAEAAGLHTVPIDVVPVESRSRDDTAIASILNVWQDPKLPISHIISIERAGPSADGVIRNMRGDDITPHTASLEVLFTLSQTTTIGIGDAGNELGMGNLPKSLIAQCINTGEQIACTVPCHYLIVCGVSNWGAEGLLVSLALLRPEWARQLTQSLTVEMDRQILTTLVYKGPAVDGDRYIQDLFVDTLPWEHHGKVLDEILNVLS